MLQTQIPKKRNLASRGDFEDEEVLQEEAEYAKESEQKRINGGDMMDPKEIEQMHQQYLSIQEMTKKVSLPLHRVSLCFPIASDSCA